MKRVIVLLLGAMPLLSNAQRRMQAELFTGIAAYSGDLTQSPVQLQSLRPALQINFKYEMQDQLYWRAGIAWGMLGASDKYNDRPELLNRNLSFQSQLIELTLGLEYAVLPPDLFDRGYPYIFAGVGAFHFNPYAFDDNNNKVYLQPLSTEGQGLAQYPNRKPYKLTQFCIPFGAGFTFPMNDRFALSGELAFRKIFTDYLDDVSSTYVDANVLKEARGPLALAMSYRGTKKNTGYDPAPPEGNIRGNSTKDDWYYFAGFKFSWKLGKSE